jgi:carbon storage regulator
MLVLSRKLGESICIDDCIKITITGIDRNKVRIGITAPAEMRIDREEVRNRLAAFFDNATAETHDESHVDEAHVVGVAE